MIFLCVSHDVCITWCLCVSRDVCVCITWCLCVCRMIFVCVSVDVGDHTQYIVC